jgi:AcrR family transcriptional regulator
MPKRVDHDERRRQIVEALWRITIRGGLGAASFREVAQEAGVSVRLIQYYFGTKAELLHDANQRVAERMGARIRRRVVALGPDPHPRDVVRAATRAFLPSDRGAREAMVLFYAFYTAQMTDPSLGSADGTTTTDALTALLADQIRHAQARGASPADLDASREGALLTAALPGIVSGVIMNFLTAAEATRILDYAVDRLFPATRDG